MHVSYVCVKWYHSEGIAMGTRAILTPPLPLTHTQRCFWPRPLLVEKFNEYELLIAARDFNLIALVHVLCAAFLKSIVLEPLHLRNHVRLPTHLIGGQCGASDIIKSSPSQ